MTAGAGLGWISGQWLGLVERVALLFAAALPWCAMFSGTFGMYFFLLLAAVWVGELVPGPVGDGLSDVIFVFMWAAVVPLAVLLLLALPACLAWSCFRGPLTGFAGHVGQAACLTSMFFSAVYFSIILGILVFSLVAGEPVVEPGYGHRIPSWWPLLNLVVLPSGFLATWRAWRLLRGSPGAAQPLW